MVKEHFCTSWKLSRRSYTLMHGSQHKGRVKQKLPVNHSNVTDFWERRILRRRIFPSNIHQLFNKHVQCESNKKRNHYIFTLKYQEMYPHLNNKSEVSFEKRKNAYSLCVLYLQVKRFTKVYNISGNVWQDASQWRLTESWIHSQSNRKIPQLTINDAWWSDH